MASAFSHIAVPIAIQIAVGKKKLPWRLLLFGIFLSIAPDFDTLAFRFGIPYESQWGHRGFTHSICFAAVFSLLPLLCKGGFKASGLAIYLTSFVSMVSHGVLDALTTGGLGVAFFWPMTSERFFFPWQVIEVSPISVSRFFTQRGIAILASEFYFVWLPFLTLGLIILIFRMRLANRVQRESS